MPRNYTWHVLKQSAFFNPGGTFDRDLAEYAMTLIGTVIAQRQATGQARVSAIMQIIEKTAMIENMLAASMSPSMAAALDWSRGMQSRSIVP